MSARQLSMTSGRPERLEFAHTAWVERSAPAEAHEATVQDALLDYCAELTGTSIRASG